MKSRFLTWTAAVLVVFTLASCKSSTDSTAGNSDIVNGVYKPGSSPFGSTYAEWSAKWWQWAFGQSVHTGGAVTHPLLDKTGANADKGQTDANVYFLAGWFGAGDTVTRTVTISSSKALFLPIINTEVDTTGGWTADSVAKYTAITAAY